MRSATCAAGGSGPGTPTVCRGGATFPRRGNSAGYGSSTNRSAASQHRYRLLGSAGRWFIIRESLDEKTAPQRTQYLGSQQIARDVFEALTDPT